MTQPLTAEALAAAADQVWQDVRAEGNVALLHAIRVLRDRTGAGIRECADALRASQARAQEGAIVTEAGRLRAQVRAEVAEQIAQAIEAKQAIEPAVIAHVSSHAARWGALDLAARIAREHASAAPAAVDGPSHADVRDMLGRMRYETATEG